MDNFLERIIFFINFFKQQLGIFFIFYLVNSYSTNDSLTFINPITKKYSSSLLYISPKQFNDHLLSLEHAKTDIINISNIVTKYNIEIKRESSTFLGKFKSFLKTPERAELVLEKIIDYFNFQARNFSIQVEKVCLELIFDAKEKGIFENYENIDNIDNIKEELESIGVNAKKSLNNKKGIIGSVTGTALSIINQDPYGTIIYMSSSITYLYDIILNNKLIKNEEVSISKKQKINHNLLSKSQLIELESKIFIFSQLYCSLGYNLQIILQNSTIQLIGDNVPYLSMINLITSLEQNINLNLIKLTSNSEIDSNNYLILNFQSTLQRLNLLKTITNYLYNLVSFSFQIHISKLNLFASKNSLNEFEVYLNIHLDHLNMFVTKLNTIFPLSKDDNYKFNKLIEEQFEIQLLYLDILDFIQNSSEIYSIRYSDRISKENKIWWKTYGIIGENLIGNGLNLLNSYKIYFRKYCIEILEIMGIAPYQIFNYLIIFLNKILYILLTSPAGFIIFMCCLIFIEISFGGFSIFLIISKRIINILILFLYRILINLYNLCFIPCDYIFNKKFLVCKN